MYDPSTRPRNPVTVAELNDAQKLRSIASAVNLNLDDMKTQPGQKALILAAQIINGAAKELAQ